MKRNCWYCKKDHITIDNWTAYILYRQVPENDESKCKIKSEEQRKKKIKQKQA